MRTALRRTVWAGEDPTQVPTPEAAAQAVRYLLSPAAVAVRGKLLDLREPESHGG
jgi:hypothetical protein